MFVTLAKPVPVLLAWVYGFISLCSLVAVVHPKIRRPEGAKIRHAILKWWPVSLVGGVTVAPGTWTAVPIFALVSAITLREYLAILPASDRHPALDALALAGVALHHA